METNGFEKNQVYDNVYLVFIDASGHSNVVKKNPHNVAEQAFDLLYENIHSRLKRVVNRNQCETAVIWSWLGDGGLIAIYDKKEANSLNTALNFVQDILNLDLPHLQDEFKNESIKGELHIRIAVHKGTIKYTEDGQQGFIHSADINWGAHLEKATPRDSVAISKNIYDILQLDQQAAFVHVGVFEDRNIYVSTPNSNQRLICLNWSARQGFTGCEKIQCYLERLSQNDKAHLIDSAQTMVIDFGTTLNTCSNYLFSTERPVPYRDAVYRLLERGGSFVCYMLEPNSEGSKQLVALRKEDTEIKLEHSLSRFQSFKRKNANLTKNFKVFQMSKNPNLAAMIIDPESDDSLCLYSPYLNGAFDDEMGLGRADMPHYLVNKRDHKIYQYIWEYVSSYIKNAKSVL